MSENEHAITIKKENPKSCLSLRARNETTAEASTKSSFSHSSSSLMGLGTNVEELADRWPVLR